MPDDILDPLDEYIHVFHPRFKEVAEKTFESLSKEAQIDVEANRKTCSSLYEAQKKLSFLKTRAGWWKFLCVLLWMAVITVVIIMIVKWNEFPTQTLFIAGMVAAVILFCLFSYVHPFLKELKSERKEIETTIDRFRKEAWKQMEPLNSLYDWDILTRMMAETVPKLEFDPYFTTQRLADLEHTYGWDGSFNASRSVVYSLSGLIRGNPFVLCRTRKMKMGKKTYYGQKTIFWTTRERDSDGKYHTVQHSQTLTASVTRPYPEYFEKTRLIYGNTAAPDLIFYRQQSGLASRKNSWAYRMKRRALRKKARDLSNADFAMMTNEEFEVVFDTSNRNDNQQFALLFTPLAQENILKLLKDKETGYGDDFDFRKDKMINTIEPEHLQNLELDMNPRQYMNFDFEKAKADFYAINARYFRAIYFSLAPLLCVPAYQQIRPLSDIYGRDMKTHSSFWEHEALANFWGGRHFKHPDCVTSCILKTEATGKKGDSSTIEVTAYGYCAEDRLTYVPKFGGDGRFHDVPVYWKEYLPVTGTGEFYIQEDNRFDDKSLTGQQRMERIHNVLSESGLDMYRRHIASKV